MKLTKIKTIERGAFKDKVRTHEFDSPLQLGASLYKVFSITDNREIIIKTITNKAGGKNDRSKN